MFDKLMNVLKEAAKAVPQNHTVMTLPEDFKEFPVYSGTIVKGPHVDNTVKYKRITYRVDGGMEEYKNLLNQYGYTQKTDVRFENSYSNGNSYIIIEKEKNYYKLAFHKKK